MRISDATLDAAFDTFGGGGFNDESIRALVSFVVYREIDYESAIENRHGYGRPKCYEGLDEDGCYCRKQVTEDVNAALGIEGGDDGS